MQLHSPLLLLWLLVTTQKPMISPKMRMVEMQLTMCHKNHPLKVPLRS